MVERRAKVLKQTYTRVISFGIAASIFLLGVNFSLSNFKRISKNITMITRQGSPKQQMEIITAVITAALVQ